MSARSGGPSVGCCELDADVLNAVYITPHSWTPAGRAVRPEQAIQADQSLYTYRNQVLHAPRLAPWQLFLGVKMTEALYHLRPRALLRPFFNPDRRFRRIMRSYLAAGARVVLAELAEFLFRTRFESPGSMTSIPGFPAETRREAGPPRTFTAADSYGQ